MDSIAPLMMAGWAYFLNNPACLVLMIPIVAILIGGIMGMAKLIVRHRERMAMIERGMNPDEPVERGK